MKRLHSFAVSNVSTLQDIHKSENRHEIQQKLISIVSPLSDIQKQNKGFIFFFNKFVFSFWNKNIFEIKINIKINIGIQNVSKKFLRRLQDLNTNQKLLPFSISESIIHVHKELKQYHSFFNNLFKKISEHAQASSPVRKIFFFGKKKMIV